MKSPQEQFEILKAGANAIISEESLLEKLQENRPLRVKLGFDPSSPDIHLGHAVILEKIRQFQDLGHQAVIIIGDYTAMIGDPTGRSKTRPALEPAQIAQNARTYQDQIFKIIDPDKTEVRRNSEWFAQMSYADVLKLNARMSVARMMERDDFKKRFESGVSITLTEFQYPLMQGHDSVMIRSDVELGGNDQLFNNLVGRDLQSNAGQPQQTVMVMPILEGLDGVQKMSKSLDNYIGVAEPATTMFGKAMSISDELMARWYPLILGTPLDANAHPMERKKISPGPFAPNIMGQQRPTLPCAISRRAFPKKTSPPRSFPFSHPPPTNCRFWKSSRRLTSRPLP
ncbi:tyrosine--tRNA ligase [Oscillatoria laete-virens NRMC-F 0139]|nr:tyrosine--tRNA ligase [Oscillatoria laete-virens]MDL5052756.1 tyrosine--tRNA ligase [Oscillatoria laete-virens NRMC-F 0139]